MSSEPVPVSDHPPDTPVSDATPGALPDFKVDRWGPIAMMVTGLVMAVVSWQKWQDLLVDYGQQVYIAWQISEGQVLYRDMTYLYGPLSAYVHGLLFKIFEPGIMVMAWFNLGVLACLAGILYALLHKLADSLTATLAVLAFFMVFAFGQYDFGGNYNFVCAYVSELPHGVFISFIALYQFTQYAHDPGEKRLALLGGLLGLIYMTKPEVFLAATTALVAGVALKLSTAPARARIRGGLIFSGSFAVPLLLLTMYFWFHLSLNEAIKTMLSPWVNVFFPPFRSLPLYKWITGTGAVAINLGQMLSYAAFLIGVMGGVLGINYLILKMRGRPALLAWPVAGLAVAAAVGFSHHIALMELGRAWPLFMALFTGYGFFRFWKCRGQPEGDRHLALLVFATFSLVLLFKIFLNAHVYHYGFALALPATLLLIKWAAYDFPQWTQRFLGSPVFTRVMAMTLILVYIGGHAWFSFKIYDLKGYPVGAGLDTVVDYRTPFTNRGEIFNATLEYINRHLAPEAEFVTLPDAIMLNYMARRKSPIKYVNLSPGQWMIVGNDPVLRDLKASAPPYIMLVDQKSPSFGYPYFGKDFGKPIYAWVMNNYSLEKQFGAEPFADKGFGIQILKKIPPKPER